MAEVKLPRLLAAAKEFNIGQDTLIDFLIGKGFSKDDLKPTSKLTEDMYRALQSEFQSDKAAKMKSDQVDLPKGAQAEAKKKKEEEEILFKKRRKETSCAEGRASGGTCRRSSGTGRSRRKTTGNCRRTERRRDCQNRSTGN